MAPRPVGVEQADTSILGLVRLIRVEIMGDLQC